MTTATNNNNNNIVTFARIAPAPESNGGATPLPRSSHGLSALGSGRRLVLYGGENVARTPIADAGQVLWLAEKNNEEDDNDGWKWISPAMVDEGGASSSPRCPPSRVAHSQAAVGDAVYIFGGRAGVEMGENAMNDLWKLEITATDEKRRHVVKWTEVTPLAGEIPEPRSFHKMIAISTDLYVFGGCGASSGRLNDLWKFDTVRGRWSNLGTSGVLKGRGGPCILSLLCSPKHDDNSSARIAIVAGFAGEETNDGHVFDNNSWESKGMDGLSDMRKRSVCSFGSLSSRKNMCLIFGGEVDPSNLGHEGAGNFEKDLILLDGTSGALLDVIKPRGGEAWPEARGWADACVGGDTFYLFGGLAGDDASPKRLDDLWQCRVSSSD